MDFIKAKHFTDTGAAGRSIDLLVIHDMEAPEDNQRAESCARFFATTTKEASAHYCVDNNSAVQCVKDPDVAWAAPGANSDGLQFEFAGYAKQTTRQWKDEYGIDMLKRGARLFAEKCERYDIPALFRDANDLRANKRGITTHHEVSLAFKISTHTDPGPNFPISWFITLVKEQLGAGHKPRDEKADLPTIRFGDTTWLVKKAQAHLKRHGYYLEYDRGIHFDAHTEHAVVRFQRDHNLKADGVIGAATWRKLRS